MIYMGKALDVWTFVYYMLEMFQIVWTSPEIMQFLRI